MKRRVKRKEKKEGVRGGVRRMGEYHSQQFLMQQNRK